MEDLVIKTIKENGGSIDYDTLLSIMIEYGETRTNAIHTIRDMVMTQGLIFYDKDWRVAVRVMGEKTGRSTSMIYKDLSEDPEISRMFVVDKVIRRKE